MTDRRDNQPWTISRLLEWTREFFESKGIDDARLEAELLLAHALGTERIQLYARFAEVVAEAELGVFRDLVRRRAARVPTQYLLGVAYFRDLELRVTPAVMVPRPETEILVDEALVLLRPQPRPAWEFEHGEFVDRRDEADRPEPIAHEPRVLDVCTGSGCIAIALAHECPAARVVAADASAEALAVARENAGANGVAERITFLEGDLLAPLAELPDAERVFDLLTANPPYIAESAAPTLMPEVREHEPHQALFAGPTGLEVIDRLLAEAPDALRPGGRLLMEIGYDQANAIRERLGTLPAWQLEDIRRDLAGHERVVHLRRV